MQYLIYRKVKKTVCIFKTNENKYRKIIDKIWLVAQNHVSSHHKKMPHRLDWDTHQIISENRECFACQWRATPSGSFMPVDYKGGEHSNLIITRSFITSSVRFL